MTNFVIALIRTVVPIMVGWALAQLARLGLDLGPDIAPPLIEGLAVLLASLYYVSIAWLERRFAWVGWLLGIARNPIYGVKPSDEVLAKHALLTDLEKHADEQAALARITAKS